MLPVDERAAKIKAEVLTFTKNGERPLSILDSNVFGKMAIPGESGTHATLRPSILHDMETLCRRMDSIRNGSNSQFGVTDVCFSDTVRSMYGFSSIDDFLRIGLGIEPSRITIEKLWSSPEYNLGYRWLVPEVILAAMKLGLRKPPIHDSLIMQTIAIDQPEAKMPLIDMTDSMPSVIGEADTIPTGSFSFGQKTVNSFKIGTGLKVTDEVIKYVTLNMLSLYMSDMPVRLNNAIDVLALSIIMNGNQAGEAAPVIGVKTANAFDYRDLIRVWARGSRMGRDFTTLLADEDVSIDLLLLKEFFGFDGVAKAGKLNLKSNIPSQSDLFIHGVVAANSLLLVDKNAALIKLMVEALSLESERIVQNGINATYLKTRLGFAKMYQDAAVILNNTIAYNPIAGQAGGFPVYMDPKPIETAILKGRAAI